MNDALLLLAGHGKNVRGIGDEQISRSIDGDSRRFDRRGRYRGSCSGLLVEAIGGPRARIGDEQVAGRIDGQTGGSNERSGEELIRCTGDRIDLVDSLRGRIRHVEVVQRIDGHAGGSGELERQCRIRT